MKNISELISWFFLGCLVVLVVTHAEGFATATTAVGGQIRGAGALLTGQGTKYTPPSAGFLAQTQRG